MGQDQPKLPCCEPFQMPFPSGWSWAHSKSCRGRDAITMAPLRGQKVRYDRAVAIPGVRTERHPPGLRAAYAVVPVRISDGIECPAHPGQPLVGCNPCELIADDARSDDAPWEGTDDQRTG